MSGCRHNPMRLRHEGKGLPCVNGTDAEKALRGVNILKDITLCQELIILWILLIFIFYIKYYVYVNSLFLLKIFDLYD